MPVILRINGYRFFFYSNEGDPLEPAHVHVSKAGSEAKIWLEPEAVLSRNDGFGARELREVIAIATEHFSWRNGMNISPKLVRFDDNSMWVELLDGRIIGVPLVWFPRLLRAQPEQLTHYELSQRGIHWDELDEDISIAGLLAGQGDITHRPHRAA